MKKYILILFLIVFIIPSVVFASWWNPFTWFQKTAPVAQPVAIMQPVIPTPASNSKISSNQIPQKNIPKNPIKKKIVVANPPVVVKNEIPSQDNSVNTPPPTIIQSQNVFPEGCTSDIGFSPTTGIFCNGTTTTNTNQNITPPTILSPQTSQNNNTVTQNVLPTVQNIQSPNTTLCNGTTYTLVCPAGRHFFCPTNGEGGKCVTEDAQYCNGTVWNACPIGENFSCSSAGGVCSPPPTQIVVPRISIPPVVITPPIQPILPVLPTVAQQTTKCQQQYTQSVSSLDLFTQGQNTYYNNMATTAQQFFNQCGANGTCMSGMAGQARAQLDQAQAGLAKTASDHDSSLENLKNLLQDCLNAISK